MTNCTTFSWCYWPKRKIPSLNFRLDGALCKPCFANTFVLCTICTFNASALRKFACTGHVVRAQHPPPPPPQKKKQQRNNPIIYCKVRFTWSTAPMAVLWSFSLWPIANSSSVYLDAKIAGIARGGREARSETVGVSSLPSPLTLAVLTALLYKQGV